MRFTTNTSLWLTFSLSFIVVGSVFFIAFLGQVALELPYHLLGTEITATVGNLDTDPVMVYYFPAKNPDQIVSSKLRGVERLPQKARELAQGEQIQVLYIPGNTEEVLPKAVSQNAGKEIGFGLLGGIGIASPGIVLMIWLIKTRQLMPKRLLSLFKAAT